MQTITKTCTLTVIDNNHNYEFLLGVSTDTLIVLDNNKELVEWIVEGNDTNGVVAQADNEDEFLDSIIIIKEMIASGLNPLTWLRK